MPLAVLRAGAAFSRRAQPGGGDRYRAVGADRGGPDLVVGPTGIEAALDRLFARQQS